MLKKKALTRIFISTLVFFIILVLYGVHKSNVDISSKPDIENNSYLYTLNNDGYISRTSIYVSKDLSLEEKIKEKIDTMIKESNRNMLLPSYFKPIIPVGTKVEKVERDGSVIKIYFSKEFMNISKDGSEKMLEAIIYTITEENILGVEIYVGGSMLKYVPNTKKEVPSVLTRDFGINKTYNVNSSNDIVKIVMNYYGKDGNNYYDIPITKYLNTDKEKLEVIMDELNKSSSNLISFIDNTNIISYEFKNKTLTLVVDKDIDYENSKNLIKTIFDNYDINKIIVYYDSQKKFEKSRKDIEKS